MSTASLNNSELLRNTKYLVRKEQEITAKILQHLEEIERRKLYSKLKYSSLFEYCLTELGYSEAQAQRRIAAMRLGKQVPEVKQAIDCGKLSLTNANQLGDLFKKAQLDKSEKGDIVKQVLGTTKKECELIVDEIKKSQGIEEKTKKEIKRSDGDKIRLHVSLDKRTIKKLNHLKGLLAHKGVIETEELIDMMLDNMIETVEKKKFKSSRKSNAPVAKSRYIKKEIKEKVYKNANGKCENCGSIYALELDHKVTFARKGKNSADNLQFLCRNCNARKAIDDYGQAKMDLFLQPKAELESNYS